MYARTIEVTDRVDNCYTVTRIVCIFMQSVIRIIRLNLSISEAMIKQKKKKKKKKEKKEEKEKGRKEWRENTRVHAFLIEQTFFFFQISVRVTYTHRDHLKQM